MTERPLWTPSPDRIAQSSLWRFMKPLGFTSFEEVLRFSVDEPEAFWTAVWDFCDVRADERGGGRTQKRAQPGARVQAAHRQPRGVLHGLLGVRGEARAWGCEGAGVEGPDGGAGAAADGDEGRAGQRGERAQRAAEPTLPLGVGLRGRERSGPRYRCSAGLGAERARTAGTRPVGTRTPPVGGGGSDPQETSLVGRRGTPATVPAVRATSPAANLGTIACGEEEGQRVDFSGSSPQVQRIDTRLPPIDGGGESAGGDGPPEWRRSQGRPARTPSTGVRRPVDGGFGTRG